MCGIAGIVRFGAKVHSEEIQKMNHILRHRGPDGEGIWINEQQTVGLGHRRLSIIDLSENAAQPMRFANRYTITYNGEIYNYKELREELIKTGQSFKSTGDTEVLLALYQRHGEKMLEKLDGMFAFAIWDEQEQKLFCARDRFGEKPFFYYHTKDAFYFASEMKALFAVGAPCDPDHEMLATYLILDIVTDPNDSTRTFFRNIKRLSTGSRLEIFNQEIQITSYYQINTQVIQNKDHDSTAELYQLLNESVQRRMRSDVRIGSSLSGGLDSSSIVYLIKNNLKETQNTESNTTFSARFHEAEYSEDEYLQTILTSLQLENKFVYPDARLLHKELENIFYHQEEPFITASIINQWAVMRLAKENNTTVLLDGQGADELLAGYPWYQKVYFAQLYTTDKKKLIEEENACIKNGFEKLSLSIKDLPKIYLKSGVDTINRWIHFAFQKTGSHTLSKNALWHGLIKPDFLNMRSVHISLTPSYPFNLNEVLKLDFRYVLEPLLRYADRNSSAFGREVRLPFLSKDLVDFSFSLPASEKINGGWQKYILRKAMENRLPDKIVWRRKKMGFGAPQDAWLNAPENRDFIWSHWQYLQKEGIIQNNIPLISSATWKVLMISLLLQNCKSKFGNASVSI